MSSESAFAHGGEGCRRLDDSRTRMKRALLLALAAVASPAANAAAPVLEQDTVVSWPDPNAVGFNSRLPANTTITKHQYRYAIWNGSEIPASWTRDWTDLLLANTRCHVATNPGTPSETRTPEATGAACATTGSDATKHYRFITKVPNLPNGARFHFEVRAVNNDGNSDTVEFNIALPADPSGIVTIPDAVLEGYLRERAVARVPSIGTNPMTQLDLARVRVILKNVGAGTAVNRIRSFEGIQHALNLELLLIANHQVLDFQRLAGLHMLEVINFNGSLLSDVSPLQNVVSLEELYLNRGRTYPPPGVCTGTAAGPVHGQTPWPPTADCPADQVDNVVVKDLSSLRRLTKLRRLWLCDQRVSPQHLTTFVNMEAMSYCRNDLRDISGLRGLTKMEDLYLFENRIEDVSPLAGMTELDFLQLHDNAIRDVSSLSGLTKLAHVYLSDNPLDAGMCSTGGHATRAACTDASGTWTTSVVSTLTPLVTGSCSVAGQTTEADCTSNSGTWTAGALKLIDLRGDTQLTDADVAALSGLTGVTVLHDADIRPAAPSSLTATTTARTATLSWTDPSNAAIAAYQYRHRQGTGPWSDWTMTPEHESSFHYWNRGDPALASLTLSDLPGGANTVELRAMVASDYNNARNRNSDGTAFTAIKTHQTAVTAAAVGAGRWDVGRVLTPGASASTTVNFPVTASIASTAPTALAETNLDGARVTVELSGTTFGASLAASNFTLQTSGTIAGLSIASVSRSSDTRATLTLRFDFENTNFDTQATLAVRVLAAALSSASDLDTQTVAVAPTLRLVFGGPSNIDTVRAWSVDEDPAGSNNNVGAYNIALTGQPTGAVTVTPTSSNSDVTMIGTFPLSFDGTNWNTTQTVGVRASQDGDAIDDIAVISHAVTGIPGLTAGRRLTLTVNDDETQGLTLTTTTLTSLGVTEGNTVTYTARLASAPTGPVRVQITSNDGAVSVDTDGTAAGEQNTLLFNATNYNTPQTVSVRAAQDDDGESESVTLNHVVFGADYQDLDDVAVTFTVTDDDTRGATLSTGGVSYVVQENGSRQYTLVLDTQPVNGNVSVAVASSATTTVTAAPSTLTFTAQNWNVPQSITISGVDDANTVDNFATVTHTASGADYGSVTIPDLGVWVSDDDVAGLKVLPSVLTVSEGGTGTYTVRLNAAPTATVTVTVAAASAKVTADTDTGTPGDQTTLSFNATNWNTAQTVTVTGAADDDGADESVGISHSVTGTGNYASLPAFQRPGLVVQVRDDETAGVVVSPTSLTIDEGGMATYTVRLSAPPTGAIAVRVAATGPVGLTLATSTLTFGPATWDTAQTVTVTAAADHARLAGGTATLTHVVTGTYPVAAGPDLPVQVRNTTVDYDADADGLIEIANLARLNAVRWDLDGDGTATSTATTTFAAAFPNPRGGAVCPTTITSVACTGYELATDLDFDTNGNGRTWTETGGTLTGGGDEYDNGGQGWEPIGTDAERFAAVFRGNGRTIDNLFVNRDGLVGLFGATDATARIESVGVRKARVVGSRIVGILAGEARGDVVACYVSGAVGSPTASIVGGLVGRLRGDVTASYSSATVVGSDQVGGLIGTAIGGSGQTRTVSGSYAVGRTSPPAEGSWAGGLVGRASPVLPESAVAAPDSYYDSVATARTQSARGEAKTTAALRTPTRYTGIYANWNIDLDGDSEADDPWDFGSSVQYPSLKWRGFDVTKQFAGILAFASAVPGKSFTVGRLIARFQVPVATGGEGTVRYSARGLPPGLWFDGDGRGNCGLTRSMCGTPSEVGTWTMTVTARDGVGATAALMFQVEVAAEGDVDAGPPAAVPDEALREAAARALGRSGGAVTEGDLLSLEELDASWSGVSNLAGLSLATNLRRLVLGGNAVSDLSELSGLRLLAHLDLSDNAVSDLSALSGLTRLETLLLSGNQVSDISPLRGMAELKALVLDGNAVSDLAHMVFLESLEELSLSGNPLGELSPLCTLLELKWLWLADSGLSDISKLSCLRDLERLWLADNAVEDVGPLSGMRRLAWLDLERNAVSSVDALRRLEALARLRLGSNRVSDAGPLAANGGLGEGDVAGLRGNPLSEESIQRHVPALRERGATVLAGLSAPWFASAGDAGRQSFVRLVNRSEVAGEALVWGVDDAGARFGPARVSIGAGRTAHFNSEDLELGNAAKGLTDGIGAPMAGDWRLEILSTLDLEAQTFLRAPGGPFSALHDGLPRVGETLRAAFLPAGRERSPAGALRVSNPTGADETVMVWGFDDAGRGRLATGLVAPAGRAVTVSASDLERWRLGAGRGLGRGEGNWRLELAAPWPLAAQALAVGDGGRVGNLSGPAAALGPGVVARVPLFPPASATGRAGVARVWNLGAAAGEVLVTAVDDAGVRAGPVSLALEAFAAAEFDSRELEEGGGPLAEGVGAPTRGSWRLELRAQFGARVHARAVGAGGYATGLLEAAPRSGGAARVSVFNPGSNRAQRSLLRLANNGAEEAMATIEGVDDAGRAGGAVGVTVPAGEALWLSAAELESGGDGFEGSLGDGEGKWRLTVSSAAPLAVMSLVEDEEGALSNLSTPGRR